MHDVGNSQTGSYIVVWFTKYMYVHTNVVSYSFTCRWLASKLASGFKKHYLCRHSDIIAVDCKLVLVQG